MAIPNIPDANTFPMQVARPGDSQLAVQRKEELVGYAKSFYRASWDWRSSRYHASWDKFDRNYHSLYDPVQLARKEPWQSHMFVGVAMQNVEIICNSIYKIMMAPRPPVECEAGPDGDALQAELIQDAEAYERSVSIRVWLRQVMVGQAGRHAQAQSPDHARPSLIRAEPSVGAVTRPSSHDIPAIFRAVRHGPEESPD